ncbi:GNAT family N-acetyltransferase [Massilia sp. Dwa41.01b]|uniref:GNAT family N-acetyltransferase n=1 Tax=Massilia sp. Dwa41.01b TaxID=2709302 RepID=UPI00185F6611|nr:GNAT family N-acetyltransferase [Massilia sp. Dwa41.01b]QNA90257.1 GNAT family N-acetyltransferase [Massilia sp. Dwa41.01b]
MKELQIRPATSADFDAMWTIFQAHVAGGETYPFEHDTSPEGAQAYWLGAGVTTRVAALGERVLGMYRVVPNQIGRGAHVANASYMVSPAARGVGVGRLLGEHSLGEARRQGYLAMQFNYVVSTNTAAVMLWKKLGFSIVGTLPKAFRHKRLGYVDAYVMYQLLQDPDHWPTRDE